MLLCILLLRKSKNLYSSLKSSLTASISAFSEFISKGNVDSHSPNKTTFFASISISPVWIFAFLLDLSTTVPSTEITHSVHKLAICAFNSSLDTTIWVIPYWSLKSIKVIPPRFLILWIHPASLTSCPTFWMFNSPQFCVLYTFVIYITSFSLKFILSVP